MHNNFYKLMLVTNRQSMPIDEYLEFVKLCIAYGVTSIQLREKNASWNSNIDFGHKLKATLDPLNIPLIVNDSIDLAIALDAQGVHLGQSDEDARVARLVLGNDKIIGVSVDSHEHVHKANELPVDYISISPVFETNSKQDVGTIVGIDGLRQLAGQSRHTVMAIGGINEQNVREVIEAGAQGVAVISAIHNAYNLKQTIENLLITKEEHV